MNWNTLTFGDVNSADYDVYISGVAAFNAPPRVCEMLDVPGRNGQLTIDGGKYENIEVTYPAGLFATDPADYPEKISAIRNALASQTGYQRLVDTYNSDEFRLGIFSSGFNAEPVSRLRASEFDLTFNCKPQRFLISGEIPVAFPQSGGENIITYPFDDTTKTTYGITFTDNGDGTITANGTSTGMAEFAVKRVMNRSLVANAGAYTFTCTPSGGSTSTYYTLVNHASTGGNVNYGNDTGSGLSIPVDDDGTACGVFVRVMSGTTVNNIVFRPEMRPTGSSGDGTITNPTQYPARPMLKVTGVGTLGIGDYSLVIRGQDSQELYIDCEVMEAWKDSGGVKVSANDLVQYAGNAFPVLKPGNNGISLGDGITALSVTPRWWRL